MLELDLDDLLDGSLDHDRAVATIDQPAKDPDHKLEDWAEKQLTKGEGGVVWDIETGPLPEADLKKAFHEKTFEEFSASCDPRWKQETRQTRYEEYKESAWSEFVDKAPLSALTGRVLCIGMMEAGKEPILSANEAESVILANLWDLMAHDLRKGRPWVGHNIHGFDLPFCMRRSWLLQVDIPPEIRQGRYWHKLLIDTMAVWTCDSNREFVKLRDLAEAMNVGTKSDDGRRFSELWFGTPAERKQAAEYCLNDVRITAAVARKLGII